MTAGLQFSAFEEKPRNRPCGSPVLVLGSQQALLAVACGGRRQQPHANRQLVIRLFLAGIVTLCWCWWILGWLRRRHGGGYRWCFRYERLEVLHHFGVVRDGGFDYRVNEAWFAFRNDSPWVLRRVCVLVFCCVVVGVSGSVSRFEVIG